MREYDDPLEQFRRLSRRRRDNLASALGEVRKRIDGIYPGRFPLDREWEQCDLEPRLDELAAVARGLFTRFESAEPACPGELSEWDQFVRLIAEPVIQSWRGLSKHVTDTPPFPANVSETRDPALKADIERNKSEHFYRVRKALRNLVLAHWYFCRAADSLSAPTRQILDHAPSLLKRAIDNLVWLTEVFVSYSRKDRPVLDVLVKRVDEPLRERECIGLWFDKREQGDGLVGTPGIPGGVPWESVLHKKLHTLDCALALLSPSFSSSEVIQRLERPVLVDRFERNQLWLLPVRVDESKCEKHLKHIDWFPGETRLLSGSGNGTPSTEMLERCERELTAKILMAMAEASDAGEDFRYLKDRLQRERLPDVIAIFPHPLQLRKPE